jgi:hypothetical protein
MPTAHSKEVVTSALLVIGGKILSGRTKNQNIDYSYPFFDSQHGPNTNVVLRARDAQKLPIACRIGLADLAELHPDVAFARIRAHRLREHANTALELGHHLIEHRLHDRGHARHHDYIADPETRCP